MNINKDHSFSVLIPDGESWLAYPVQSCLARIPGVKVIVLSNNAWDPMRFSRYTHQFYSYPAHDDKQAKLAAIQDTLNRTKIDIILPVDTQTIRLLSEYQGVLPPTTAHSPVPKVEAINIAENKWHLAQWLRAQDIPCPETLLCRPDAAFETELAKLNFPVLLKPTRQIGDNIGVGGRGIQIFDTPEALLDFYRNNTDVEYIVQPFIKGYDMGCNVLCKAGKIEAYSIQKGFMPSQVRFEPAKGIDFLEDTMAYEVVNDLVTKLKWTGVANFDLRYDEQDKQIKIIEINPRFWGSLMGSFYAGVNFPYLSCLAGLGLEIPKAGFHPLRYVTGGAAFKIMWQSMLQRKPRHFHFDNSALDFILRDPLPKVFSYTSRACSKVLN